MYILASPQSRIARLALLALVALVAPDAPDARCVDRAGLTLHK